MNTRSGYTLLEVLIAFAVMAGVLAVLLPGQSSLLRQSSNSYESFLATSYAQSVMDRIGIVEELVAGQRRETYRNWQVELDIREGQGNDDLPEYYLVLVKIYDHAERLLAEQETVKVPKP